MSVDTAKAIARWEQKLTELLAAEPITTDVNEKHRLHYLIEEARTKLAELQATVPSATTQRIAPTRLRLTADHLFGRDHELSALNTAWQNPETHILTLVAWGGVGKTSLVARWAAELAKRDYDGATYFDWSFYSQGTHDQGTASADAFIATALRHFGDEATAESPHSPWDKGTRLAELVGQRKTLLILDGLEPLQYPPGPLAGKLKNQAIEALLKGLAQHNTGLCIVTTREEVTDLANFQGSTAQHWQLEHLSTEAGIELLEDLGVHGSAQDLTQLVEEAHGHALTLNLLGGYLVRAHGGDVRRRDRVKLSKADRTQHASNVMAAYETWLQAGGEAGKRQVALLRLLGLFDRPASPECLQALRQEPAIPELTEPLMELEEEDWNETIADLVACSLLTEDQGTLDAHPLLREHFARQLQQHHPEAWQAAHSRLFDHLTNTTEHQPATLAGLQPLYQAVAHGCQAGRYEEARANVYQDRILRGTGHDGFYSITKLGAFGADLGAVACFFTPPWSRVAPALSEADRAWLLGMAAVHLRALGRLAEAVEPMRAGVDMAIKQENWKEAAIRASNLSELEVTLGQVASAVVTATQSVAFADRSRDAFWRIGSRSTLADAQHQSGQRESALSRFREAEALQAERQPGYPRLYSLQGFRYSDLLLSSAERAAGGGSGSGKACFEVGQRTEEALRWEAGMWGAPLLDFALHHLTLGRARLYAALLAGQPPQAAQAEIEQAVDGLRAGGRSDYLPRALLTRAWLRSAQGNTTGGRADLSEAEAIAQRGPMPLHLADVALYRARLFRDREALREARRLVDLHGYGRREEEVADLEAASARW